MHLLAEPSLGPDTEAVADDQHSDHQLRIDRRPACRAVMGRQLLPHTIEVKQTIDPAQKMVGRDVILKTEIVEETALIRRLTTHHHNVLARKHREDRITTVQ
jgi:hypothetical protein